MARSRFHAMFEHELVKVLDDYIKSMGDGSCSDFSEYKRSVGYIQGLKEALAVANEVESKLDGGSGPT
jgi:hypothetical protein